MLHPQKSKSEKLLIYTATWINYKGIMLGLKNKSVSKGYVLYSSILYFCKDKTRDRETISCCGELGFRRG